MDQYNINSDSTTTDNAQEKEIKPSTAESTTMIDTSSSGALKQ